VPRRPAAAAAARRNAQGAGGKEDVVHDELFVVTGASGHIGGRLAHLLLEGHRRVRVIARREEPLRLYAAQGAQVMTGDLHDPEFVRSAFEGAHAAFTMLPPIFAESDLRGAQNRVSEAIAYGLREARVPYVVNLSSIGAEVPYGTGPIAGLHDHEERLDRIDEANILHLRPTFFMENHVFAIGAIRQLGVYPGTLRGDLPLPMIATADIAQVAASLLAGLEFEGKSIRSLLGARDYTLRDAAQILGTAIGNPHLLYVQAADEQAHQGMVADGLPSHMADEMLEMNRAWNSGKIRPEEPRLPDNTTQTTLEDWAPHFADAYRHHQHHHPPQSPPGPAAPAG
jgi:uncharacterized protein YbjT (DUF2867 family)